MINPLHLGRMILHILFIGKLISQKKLYTYFFLIFRMETVQTNAPPTNIKIIVIRGITLHNLSLIGQTTLSGGFLFTLGEKTVTKNFTI